MVADRYRGDLPAGGEVDGRDLVGAALGDDAVLAVAADGGPVRLDGGDQRALLQARTVHDRRVVVHGAGDAELGPLGVHRDAVVAGVQEPGGAVGVGLGVARQGLHAG